MDSETRANSRSVCIRSLFAGYVLGTLLFGLVWFLTRPPHPEVFRDVTADYMYETSPGTGSGNNIFRGVTVDYMYETSPGTASGNNALEVESIRFHPGFVLMTDTRGRSRLLAVDRLRKFEFHPTSK